MMTLQDCSAWMLFGMRHFFSFIYPLLLPHDAHHHHDNDDDHHPDVMSLYGVLSIVYLMDRRSTARHLTLP